MLIRLVPVVFVLLWSTGYIAAKLGAPNAEPFTFLTMRFFGVGTILAGVGLVLGLPWPRGRAALHAAVAGMLLHAAYLGAVFWAIANGMPAGVSALVVSLQPILTGLLAGPLLGEKVTARHWIGLAVGLAGTWLVLWPRVGVVAAPIPPSTIFAGALALFAIALGTVYHKRYGQGGDLRTTTAVQFLAGGVATALAALLFETRVVVWTVEFALVLGWLTLVLSLVGYMLLMVMLKRSEVTRVSALFYLVPVVTALMAWVLFDETLVSVQLVGMVMVTIAVMMIG